MNEGAELLDAVATFVRRFVILSDVQADAIALWVVHTHTIDAADCTPYLHIRSAEKRSGKTRLLEVLELLVREPLPAANISDAALFRSIDQGSPTLLLDEVDAIFGAKSREREDLRGLLNAGYRRGAVVRRMGGKTMTTLETFKVFSAKAFAGIGDLPDTIADRSIRIRLTRKTRQEPVDRYRRRDVENDAEPLQVWAAAWADHHRPHLAAARPELPDELDDRAQDVWEPLLAIGDRAGGEWSARSRSAALALSGGEARHDDSTGVRLLADVRAVFDANGSNRLSSASLVHALHDIEEAPWGEWYGKPITPRGIAKILERYEVRPRTVRFDDDTTAKGYRRDQFEDVWSRYLQPENVTPSQPASLNENGAIPVRHSAEGLTDEKRPNSAWLDRCDVVTDGIQDNGHGELAHVVAALHAGHITTGEALELERVDRLTAGAR